jgi:hypothetical protein
MPEPYCRSGGNHRGSAPQSYLPNLRFLPPEPIQASASRWRLPESNVGQRSPSARSGPGDGSKMITSVSNQLSARKDGRIVLFPLAYQRSASHEPCRPDGGRTGGAG